VTAAEIKEIFLLRRSEIKNLNGTEIKLLYAQEIQKTKLACRNNKCKAVLLPKY
jgi:hypothetical protein